MLLFPSAPGVTMGLLSPPLFLFAGQWIPILTSGISPHDHGSASTVGVQQPAALGRDWCARHWTYTANPRKKISRVIFVFIAWHGSAGSGGEASQGRCNNGWMGKTFRTEDEHVTPNRRQRTGNGTRSQWGLLSLAARLVRGPFDRDRALLLVHFPKFDAGRGYHNTPCFHTAYAPHLTIWINHTKVSNEIQHQFTEGVVVI